MSRSFEKSNHYVSHVGNKATSKGLAVVM